MKKYFYVALVALASATMFVACEPKNQSTNQNQSTNNTEPTAGTTYAGDTWITSPEQFDIRLVNDSTYSCWEWHVWCDGTTLSVEPFWGTEAQLLWMIDQSMQAEKKKLGEYHKKYRYYLVEENTEEACMEREWEGAECWLETITWIDSLGGQHTSQEYGWMPEANMKERHDYYMAKLEQIGVANHEYERVTDKTDKDACWAMNPSDDDPEKPQDPDEPKDYSQYDSLTFKCWEITQAELGMTATTYLWQTEKYVVMLYDLIGVNYTYKAVKDIEDEYACRELEDSQNLPKACWKITEVIMGVNQVVYVWDTEAGVKATVDAINESGYGTATYELTSVEDEDSCMAQKD